MNAIRRGLVKLSGHSVSPEEPDEHYAGLSKIGIAVLFAAVLAGVNFGLFAWVIFGDGLTKVQSTALTLVFAAVGVVIVLVVDRSMVFFADTATKRGFMAAGLFLVLRMALILAIGAFSSQATMPILLQSELEAHALLKREQSDDARARMLDSRFGLSGLEQEESRRAEILKSASAAARTLPPEIAQQLAAVRACWDNRASRRTALLAQGLEQEEVAQRLAGLVAVCRQKDVAATQERDRYLVQARQTLDRATKAAQNATSARDEARQSVKERLSSAEATEKSAISIRSSDVLWSLLLSSPGAAGKWALLTFLQVVLELLPLLLKFNAGQSPIGQQISVRRQVRGMQLDTELDGAKHERMVSTQFNSMARAAVEGLSHSSEAQQVMDDESLRLVTVMAPFETLNALMEGIIQQQLKVDANSRKFPRYAELFAEAMASALQRGAEAVTAKGVR